MALTVLGKRIADYPVADSISSDDYVLGEVEGVTEIIPKSLFVSGGEGINFTLASDYFDDAGAAKTGTAVRVGDVIGGVIDAYGNLVTYKKITGVTNSNIDGVMIRKKGSEYFERVVQGGEINIEWFGGKGDWNGTTGTNNSVALNKAIAYLTYKNFKQNATIKFPSGKYNFTTQVSSYPHIRILGEAETEFYCHAMTPGNEYCFKMLNPVDPEYNYGNFRTPFERIRFIGHQSYSVDPFPYKNSPCIEVNIPYLVFKKCTFHGFYRPIHYKTDAYLITHDDCTFSFNFYGMYFNGAGETNLGENIAFFKCITGNNHYGIFNRNGHINYIGGSVDYNRIRQIDENVSDLEGVTNSGMHFSGVHFEADCSDQYAYVNNGVMKIIGGWLWNAPNGNEQLFLNNRELFLSGIHMRVLGNDKYMVVNKAPTISGLTFISDSQINMIHPDLSQVYNGDFELGTLAGWNIKYGTASIVSTGMHGGTKALKLVGEAEYFSGEIVSDRIPINKQFAQIFVSLFVNSANLTGPNFYTIKFYDYYGDVTVVDVNFNVDPDYQNIISGWILYPKNTVEYTITLRSEIGTTPYALYDDVYVSYK